jgi:hypothetical protein
MRPHFRRRAIATWWIAGVASLALLAIAHAEAPRLWTRLMTWPAVLCLGGGTLLAPLSYAALAALVPSLWLLFAVFKRRPTS